MNLRVPMLLLVVFCGGESIANKEPAPAANVEIDFCQPTVLKILRDGRASFQLVFSFDVNEDGVPTNIRQVSTIRNAVDENMVTACMERWKVENMSGVAGVSATFTWKHGIGWRSLLIASAEQSYEITTSGERCPYCR